ncbi:glycine cleavage system aminomethyltransferase GcvT [Zavarzinia compransoris]|uniref:glycine cleavage system aminomethyltransferase GcvT n=1 Tax=Zavarzinia compransoris TaxID=1264899 RepID=UPI0010E8C852|nr:glycine cleavage system aminomethyltransferase GcvT [Zavarzinia compransoris]TDP46114.1 aminomethyltransferase [Zavarzinia compransoris]
MGHDEDLKFTPLYDLHRELGGKMVPFAGYAMPVQYPAGILTEHKATRAAAGLFDVSHMGQAWLEGADVAASLETLVPGDIKGLLPGQIRYTLLMAADGGILDDLMVTRPLDDADGSRLFLVVNAACKDQDFAHIATRLAGRARLTRLDDRALLALQGPKATEVMARLGPAANDLVFMTASPVAVAGIDCLVSRSGYTGEDGFEISVPADRAVALARALLAEPEVSPIGLGARDSLRLEAGLCLYGHDIDTTTDPIEASLAWTVPKRRREAADFPGAARVLAALKDGVARRRVGIRPLGRAPAREGTAVALPGGGAVVGIVTSGGFGPSVDGPVAMGYVPPDLARAGTAVDLIVRGKPLPAEIVSLPFAPHRYAKA